MNMIVKRLKSNAGETLVESMAAILIFTFASIIMLSMVSSAADINAAAKKADEEYFSQMVVVELAQGTTPGTVTFSVAPSGGSPTLSSENISVVVSGDTDGLYAYYAGTAPAGGGPA